MITFNQIKHIRSLQQKKYRNEYRQFVAEGNKLVSDLLYSRYKAELIAATDEWLSINSKLLKGFNTNIIEVNAKDLERISSLTTPNQVVAVFYYPENNINTNEIISQLSIVLDDIKDPGNLGTIIRIADWFGIKNIICSPETVDVYNPKVIQATMGSVARVNIFYTNLDEFLKSIAGKVKVYGSFLDGESIYEKKLDEHAVIIIGNESKGISEYLIPFISEKLLIPSYSINKTDSKAESLNASVATAIICAEFRRRGRIVKLLNY
jgi:TrmH family RNA methyltransferase